MNKGKLPLKFEFTILVVAKMETPTRADILFAHTPNCYLLKLDAAG